MAAKYIIHNLGRDYMNTVHTRLSIKSGRAVLTCNHNKQLLGGDALIWTHTVHIHDHGLVISARSTNGMRSHRDCLQVEIRSPICSCHRILGQY